MEVTLLPKMTTYMLLIGAQKTKIPMNTDVPFSVLMVKTPSMTIVYHYAKI
jgi:hypothetical protein